MIPIKDNISHCWLLNAKSSLYIYIYIYELILLGFMAYQLL